MDENVDTENMTDENNNLIDDREEATLGMDEIDDFDFDRAVKLMSVMEKVANVAPKSSAISGLAAAALNEMNEEAKVMAKRRAEVFAKREAEAKAQNAEKVRRAQAQAEEEARAKAEHDDALRLHPKQPLAPEPQRRMIPTRPPAPAPTEPTRRV